MAQYTRDNISLTAPQCEPGNLKEPEVLSVPESSTIGIAEGQLSLDMVS